MQRGGQAMRAPFVAGLVVLAAFMLRPATRPAAQEGTISSVQTENRDAEARPSAMRQEAADLVPKGLAEYKVILEGLPQPAKASGGGWLTSAAVAAIITGLITAAVTLLRLSAEKEREREKERIRYLDPLVVSATDLLEKIKSLRAELTTNETFWKDAFLRVKTRDRTNRALYVTAVYLARASKIRSELPFIRLGPGGDRTLLEKLDRVRGALGGKENLWEEIQDSIGSYVTEVDGTIMSYKGFCIQLLDPWDHIWFTRLMDFYKDVHMKQEVELPRITVALEDLIDFAKGAYKPAQKLHQFLSSMLTAERYGVFVKTSQRPNPAHAADAN
jgi:hypothetical protein